VVVEAQPSDHFSRESTTMIILGILLSFAAIGFLCWLLFTLAVLALPFFVAVSVGIWTYRSGAGLFGSLLVGLVAAALTLGLGQFGLAILRPTWAKFLLALAFVVPAALAGYHATHGIVQHTMPSPLWQQIFSVIGGGAVGCAALVRLAGAAGPRPQSGYLARA
jgi:hypothetical protein